MLSFSFIFGLDETGGPQAPALSRCRVRKARIVTDQADVDPVTATLRRWARDELRHWQRTDCRRVPLEEKLRDLADRSPSMRLYRFENNQVALLPPVAGASDRDAKTARAELYLGFFRSVAERLPGELTATICVCPRDRPADAGDLPVFRFQRASADGSPLIPDVDFLACDYYQAPDYRDVLPYDRKAVAVIFSGSTTGAQIDEATALACDTPRLRAARVFEHQPGVDFRLPEIVQCRDDEARSILAGYGFCRRPRLTWQEQFQRRFLLSIDGNGATCSRVAIALASQCVLMKYDSDFSLYYFRAMQPYRHYLPVRTEADVLAHLDEEVKRPGRFAAIARAGTALARRYLTRRRIEEYMALLIEEYARLVDEAAGALPP